MFRPQLGIILGNRKSLGSGNSSTTRFMFTIDTTQSGSANDTFVFPIHSGVTNINIEWGDGTDNDILAFNDPLLSHTYTSSGTYQISVTGQFEGVNFNNIGDKSKLISIDQWGDNNWKTFLGAFSGCENMTGEWTIPPNISSVTTMASAFEDCGSFNHNLGDWDVSSVTSFFTAFSGCHSFNNGGSPDINNWTTTGLVNTTRMFYQAYAFNQPVDNWNMSSVTTLSRMFHDATSFNQEVGAWDVSSVASFSQAFFGALLFNNGDTSSINNWTTTSLTSCVLTFATCQAFNQPLDNWNMSSVTNISTMFLGCTIFNQPLNSWVLNSLTTMSTVFRGCQAFNQPLNNWNVSSVTSMSNSLRDCPMFDQDISTWDIASLTGASGFLSQSTLSTANYDTLLLGWESNIHNGNVSFHGGNSKFTTGSLADTARQNLVTNDLWTIADGGGI